MSATSYPANGTRCSLTRAQVVEVFIEPSKPGVIKVLAARYNVSEDLIRHVRHTCKWIAQWPEVQQ
jgi:hypothetical protein